MSQSRAERRTPDEIEADLQAKANASRTWPVAEQFISINGEGPRTGRLAAFIRFPACNLSCSFCDTAWANAPDCAYREVGTSDLISFVSASGAECITLTGGEPLLQDGVEDLMFSLLAADPDWQLEIETNGAVDLESICQARHRWAHQRAQALLGDGDPSVLGRLNRMNVFNRQAARISFTMDWKLPSSGMESHMIEHNLELLGTQDSLKFVVGDDADLEEALDILDSHDMHDRDGVFFSPVFGQMEPGAIVEFMKRHRLSHARIQLQLHKIIWPDRERGV
jgi:7-carboxy-7-deazaguanine synthase